MNYQTELIARLMRRIQAAGTSALGNFKSDLDSTDGSVQGDYAGAEQSLKNNQKALDYAAEIVDDLGKGNKQKFDSLSSFAAATNRKIAEKKQALNALNRARSVDAAETVNAQYFNPFTGQMENISEESQGVGDIKDRLSDDRGYNELLELSDQLRRGQLGEAVGDVEAMAQLESDDFEKNRADLKRQVSHQINRVRTTMTEGYEQELAARRNNAQAFSDAANQQSQDALSMQKQTAENFATKQEREIRQSIEQDKRSLAQAASQTNASKRRNVKIRNDVDDQRPM